MKIITPNTKCYYFSGTGNTKLTTEYLLSTLRNKADSKTELLSIPESNKDSLYEIMDNKGVLGIAFPVYDYRAPRNVEAFIESLPKQAIPKPVFLIATYTLSARDCLSRISRKLREKNYFSIASMQLKCPGPAPNLYTKIPFQNKFHFFKQFENNIKERIKVFADEIYNSYNQFQIKPFYKEEQLLPFPGLNEALSKLTMGNLFYRNLKVSDDCTACGKCVSICPEQNLKLLNGKLFIEKTNGCLRCLSCVQTCPQRAINFTSAERTGDYSRKMVKEWFGKST